MQSYAELQQENETLRALVAQLQMDHTFRILNKSGLHMLYNNIPDGKDLIYIDLCNVHSANHKFTFAGYDNMINRVLDVFRASDVIAKIGGDELIVLLNSGNAEEYCNRMAQVMADNNIYAVFVAVKTNGGLQSSIDSAEEINTAVKTSLELNGMKPDRSEEYTCLDSHIIIAE